MWLISLEEALSGILSRGGCEDEAIRSGLNFGHFDPIETFCTFLVFASASRTGGLALSIVSVSALVETSRSGGLSIVALNVIWLHSPLVKHYLLVLFSLTSGSASLRGSFRENSRNLLLCLSGIVSSHWAASIGKLFGQVTQDVFLLVWGQRRTSWCRDGSCQRGFYLFIALSSHLPETSGRSFRSGNNSHRFKFVVFKGFHIIALIYRSLNYSSFTFIIVLLVESYLNSISSEETRHSIDRNMIPCDIISKPISSSKYASKTCLTISEGKHHNIGFRRIEGGNLDAISPRRNSMHIRSFHRSKELSRIIIISLTAVRLIAKFHFRVISQLKTLNLSTPVSLTFMHPRLAIEVHLDEGTSETFVEVTFEVVFRQVFGLCEGERGDQCYLR